MSPRYPSWVADSRARLLLSTVRDRSRAASIVLMPPRVRNQQLSGSGLLAESHRSRVARLRDHRQVSANERFGLASHTRRSAVSVPSNIAEGTRHKKTGYISRLVIALGEHAELETQLIIADRLGYIRQNDKERMEGLSASVGQLTHGLLRSLERGSH